MAFEKIDHFGSRCAKVPIIHIRMDGQIYIGTSLCNMYPITPEHTGVDIYINLESGQLALFPMKSAGHFNLSKAGIGSRAINCRRLLNEYQILRNEKYDCKIEDVNGERMIVFPVKFNEDKRDA